MVFFIIAGIIGATIGGGVLYDYGKSKIIKKCLRIIDETTNKLNKIKHEEVRKYLGEKLLELNKNVPSKSDVAADFSRKLDAFQKMVDEMNTKLREYEIKAGLGQIGSFEISKEIKEVKESKKESKDAHSSDESESLKNLRKAVSEFDQMKHGETPAELDNSDKQ